MLEDSHVVLCNLADSHWIIAQQSKLVIRLTTQWLKHPKDDHSPLAEFLPGQVPDQIQCQYAAQQKDFTLNRGLLYLKTTPSHSNEDVLAFMVPTHKRRAAIDGCHRYTGHQGHDRTLSLIKEQFWRPEMVQETVRSVCNCSHCIQFEARLQKPGLEPIICMEPMDLVHINYVKMEVTVGLKEKPEGKDVLVVEDHFTITCRCMSRKIIQLGPQPECCITSIFQSSVFPID